MLHSRSPSPTSSLLAALAAALGTAGCSDDTCGPGGAPPAGLAAGSDEVTLTYGNLSSLLGNDCPDPAAPEGVISLSIEGRQTDDPLGLVTLCIPRPDLLMEGDRSLGTIMSAADVRIVDLRGNAGGCSYTLDSTQPPTGSARATGVCDNGDSPDGFALSLDGAASLRRTCGTTTDSVSVTLRGQVAVSRRAL
ncbi:MAG TPA: hypothetical protein VK932_07325 [Kofleriaceae bacterium]|nr:hypothetical protein [Kofleriaceae bacterium]